MVASLILPASERLEQKDHKFEVSLGEKSGQGTGRRIMRGWRGSYNTVDIKAATLGRVGHLQRQEELSEQVPLSEVTEKLGTMMSLHQLSQRCWLPSSWEEFIYFLQFPKVELLPACLEIALVKFKMLIKTCKR